MEFRVSLPGDALFGEHGGQLNTRIPYPTVHHIGRDMCTFLFQCGVLWDRKQVHCGNYEIGLVRFHKGLCFGCLICYPGIVEGHQAGMQGVTQQGRRQIKQAKKAFSEVNGGSMAIQNCSKSNTRRGLKVKRFVHIYIYAQLITYTCTSVYVYIAIYMFVKFTFEMSVLSGRQHSFSSHDLMFLTKRRRFWDKKCLNPGRIWTPNL